MTEQEITGIIRENKKRKLELASLYNPVTGEGSPLERFKLSYFGVGQLWNYAVPVQMYKDHKTFFDELLKYGSIEELLISKGENPTPIKVSRFINELNNLRFRYDFEFWAYLTARIQDKSTKKIIPFKLNKPQRKTLAVLEKMRLKGIPIRSIMLKARQWGGSTLVQIYMAWIQIIHKKNWHSVIIADVEDQARNIRGMYSRFAKEYPNLFGRIEFLPFEGSSKNRIITDRNCIVGVGSAQKPESLRSYDFAMSHLSEVGSWKTTLERSAEDIVQAVRASIPDVPLSLEILESTARGVGNFFHREWLAAVNKETIYEPIFIPWHEIPRYQKPINDIKRFISNNFDDNYVSFLWSLGATLEGINWYISFKKGKNYSDWRMQSEFPSTAVEAFASSDMRVFDPKYVSHARTNCLNPEFIGDLTAKSRKGKTAFEKIEFFLDSKGKLFIWTKPDKSINVSDRYVVTVDIGGRTDRADYSVIKVFDRYWMMYGEGPETVATWRGHLDQDLIAWKAAQIAKYYNNALLVVESNSLDRDAESEGDHFLTILDEIVLFYPNIYARTDPEKVRQGLPIRYGFQTNLATKPMIIDILNAALRDDAYIERDIRSCDEMDTYELKPNGTMGAVEGCKDDIVMATAIGLWTCFKYLPLPKNITYTQGPVSKKIVSEATI